VVSGDQSRLRQVLTNLLGNAVKFTDEGRVEMKVVPGERRADGKIEITFTVSDTGIGIPTEKKELIFDFFTQGDDSHTREHGGIGLGLTISRELVERMGGRLGFSHWQGGGSSFHFTIPLALQGEGEKKDELQREGNGGIKRGDGRPGRLLFAEDDDITRQIMLRFMSNKGYEVEEAVNGLIAVEKWEDGDYDLILMDIQMPIMDGLEAMRTIRLRERERGKGHIPIITLTAHAFEEDRKRCLAAGADEYVTKPIRMHDLLTLIGGMLKTTVNSGP
jgi:CheY-like chemotaxis protein